MQLQINAKERIKDIQDKFNIFYPHLQIRFYKNKHEDLEASPKSQEISEEESLYTLTEKLNALSINLSPERKVTEIESDFENLAGLHVQIFRKSGEIWLQTSRTDHWSLAEQEEKGKTS